MSRHLKTTTETYDAVAGAFLEATRDTAFGASWIAAFAGELPRGTLVADLGSRPGRNCAQLREQGLAPFCLDLSMGMLRAGVAEYGGPRVQGNLFALISASEKESASASWLARLCRAAP